MRPGRVALIAGLVGYAVLVLVTIWLLSLDTLSQANARYTAVLLPMGPAVAIVLLSIRRYQKLDELAQRVHLMALSVAFVGTVLLVLTWSLLDLFQMFETLGISPLSSLTTLGALIGLYLIGYVGARRQYR
ncbi:MAG: hypothetical protein JJE47_13595 [Acidimicrobiia bacterium]|nr:hypothetical protein [Acidimicrobiia bacterium]